jgi:hypothetical protein
MIYHYFRTLPPRSGAAGHSLLAAFLLASVGCGASSGDATGPTTTITSIVLTVALPALDAVREGRYEAWTTDPSGAVHALGTFAAGGTFTFPSPIPDVRSMLVTLEPPGDAHATPSAQVLLRGTLRDGHAELAYQGAVTQSDLPLRERPGQFTMFTPSDNAVNGYPSHENAGVWLFNMAPSETPQKDYYVRMTQLQAGWTYEGWMVRDIGTPKAIWLSYGKFLPDWTGALNQPDDTGWGPFSGVIDFRNAGLEDFPGDDWISNPLGLPWPSALVLPLDLREKDATGRLRWTHVISIEPATDRGEALTTERPFFMRPYADPFGDLPAGAARTVTLNVATMPSGSVTAR